jgi:tetratricopeptide (TPR) repeat protein/transcriptional regulator with XRE-family HTH domain
MDGMLAMAEDAAATGAAKRERLAQRRKALGLTQEDLAELLGVERSTVVRWERGETEPLPWIRPKLAATLRVSADRLEELLTTAPTGSTAGADAGQRQDPGTAVLRQLPAAVPDFTGRAAELAALTGILDGAGDSAAGTVVISAIGGTAGVGKTALALHWAHQVAHRFSDGQLHVNLRGFDPSGIPITPAEAIRGFLGTLGVPPDAMPAAPEAQATLYRGLLSARKMLIVLDNARDEQQVRPLLAAGPGSLVVITSRNQLTGLAAADGARLFPLDVLTPAEAVQLLTARIGASRAAAEPEAIAEIAGLCACLPLALAVAAARAAARPGFPLSALAAELRDTASRLDALDSGDPAASVRSVFSWSYRQLTPEAARLFRLLGLHSGPDISVPAAASLAAVGEPAARRLLRELARDCLIAEHVPGRYACHDLLRAYAAAQARDADSEPDRAAAVTRLLDHYLHTGYAAARLIHEWRDPMTLTPLSQGAAPESLDGYQEAMAWFETEHHVLSAATAHGTGSGLNRHAWQLSWVLSTYLDRCGQWHERAAVLDTGLAAATRLGDIAGQAVCSRLLAKAHAWAGDYGQAEDYALRSVELAQRLGDRAGEAKTRTVLAVLAERQGRFADAISHSKQALELFQAAGHTAGVAEELNNIGWEYALLGDYQQARAFCQQALTLSAELGHRQVEGNAWDSLGYAEHHLGNFGEAAACYQRALDILREVGDRWSEADALTRLGDTRLAAGELPQARQAWRQALAILEDMGNPDAEMVRAKLAGLPPPVAE